MRVFVIDRLAAFPLVVVAVAVLSVVVALRLMLCQSCVRRENKKQFARAKKRQTFLSNASFNEGDIDVYIFKSLALIFLQLTVEKYVFLHKGVVWNNQSSILLTVKHHESSTPSRWG